TGWCEESYASTPAVADLDGDGSLEIISAAYTLRCVDAKTGTVKWQVPSGYDRSHPNAKYEGRIWSDVVVKDVDGDGGLDIVVGNRMGKLAVYDQNGYFKPGWPQTLWAGVEIKSVRAEDLDNDGTCEIVAAVGDASTGQLSPKNVWVYEHDGKVRKGWPQYREGATPVSHAWGVYHDNLCVGDLDGDGRKDILVPSDVPYICGYHDDGTPLAASQKAFAPGTVWGGVGTWEDYTFEKTLENQGWGFSLDVFTGYHWILQALPPARRYISEFAYSRAILDDLDGDGKSEVVVVGRTYDRAFGFPPPSLFQQLFVFNSDRSRYQGWERVPRSGKPLMEDEDWQHLGMCFPDPVAADLDGDGKKELLYPSYDGKLNCYWLDQTQKHSFPVNVYDGMHPEYTTAPAVVDLDKDGHPELIFTTYTDKLGTKAGSLYVCNYKGQVLHRVPLPQSLGTNIPNGGICSPVVKDIDGDGVFEVVFNGFYSGVTVYNLPVRQ
ncbi:MAG: VCBS repeat-containing protein, partial [Oscillospiraceae bacterium]